VNDTNIPVEATLNDADNGLDIDSGISFNDESVSTENGNFDNGFATGNVYNVDWESSDTSSLLGEYAGHLHDFDENESEDFPSALEGNVDMSDWPLRIISMLIVSLYIVALLELTILKEDMHV